MSFQVSLIIPVYNAAAFLEEAVLSAVQQKEVAEIILIEDGSSDQSLILAKNLERQFEKISLYQHPDGKNHGAGASRNLGLQKARFPYLAFLDADDLLLENRFKTCQQIFQAQADALGVYEAVGSQFQTAEQKKLFIEKVKGRVLTTMTEPIAPDQLFETLLLGQKGWWHLNGLTIKRALIEQVGLFDESLLQSQDLDFNLRCSLTEKIYPGSLTHPVALRRIHQHNRIFDRNKAKVYKKQLYEKWLATMLQSNWSKACNRFLWNTTLSYHPKVSQSQTTWARRLKKLSLAIVSLIRSPKLLKKLL